MSYVIVSLIHCGFNKMEQVLTQQISMAVLKMMFPGRLISHFEDITWPTHLPDFAVPDYFLWSYVKSKVYNTHLANIDDLKW
jgi:hypothetical protein